MPKLPSVDGLKEVRKKLKKDLEQKPSEALISIIDEVTRQNDLVKKKDSEKSDIAARDNEADL